MKKKAKQLRKNLKLSRDLLRQLSNDDLKKVGGATNTQSCTTCNTCGC